MNELEPPLARIGSLVEEIEKGADVETRERARALVQAILDIHRVGLERVLELAGRSGDGKLIDELAGEESVALLLALHGIHPRDLETRIKGALDEIGPRLHEQGVLVELDAISDDAVRVRLRPEGPVRATSASLRTAVEGAIGRHAPEIAMVEIEGLDATNLVPLARLRSPGPKD